MGLKNQEGCKQISLPPGKKAPDALAWESLRLSVVNPLGGMGALYMRFVSAHSSCNEHTTKGVPPATYAER